MTDENGGSAKCGRSVLPDGVQSTVRPLSRQRGVIDLGPCSKSARKVISLGILPREPDRLVEFDYERQADAFASDLILPNLSGPQLRRIKRPVLAVATEIARSIQQP